MQLDCASVKEANKNSLCDVVCEVISHCVWNCDMGKIYVRDKIVIENLEIVGIFFKHKSPFERGFCEGNYLLAKAKWRKMNLCYVAHIVVAFQCPFVMC